MPPFSPGNRVLVLGAGATRGADFASQQFQPSCKPPLNADFFTQLQRIGDPKYSQLVAQVVTDVVRLFGSNFSLTLEDYFTQLEFLSEAIKIGPSTAGEISASDLRKARDRLLHAVSVVLEMSTDVAIRRSSGCKHHEKLVKHMRTKDTFISFNYDCVLDHALRQHGDNKWSARYGYTFPNPSRIEGVDRWDPAVPAPDSTKTAYLLKLHGSLNWQLPDPPDPDAPAHEKHHGTIRLKQRLHGQRGVPFFSVIPPSGTRL